MAYGWEYRSDNPEALVEKRFDHRREVGGRKLKAVKQQHDRARMTIVSVSVVVRHVELTTGAGQRDFETSPWISLARYNKDAFNNADTTAEEQSLTHKYKSCQQTRHDMLPTHFNSRRYIDVLQRVQTHGNQRP